jgi:hypothetical protein
MKSPLPGSKALQRFLADHDWQTSDVARQMGAANRHGVFLLQRGDRRAVLKLHESPVAGRRDAFAHEALMHSFYADEARDAVPRLLAQDVESRALIFDYVQGAPVSGAVAGKEDIQRMANFLLETNRADILDRAKRWRVPAASESGFSATEHWHCAMSRLDALLALTATDAATSAMQEFVRFEVRPALDAAKPLDGEVAMPCLSPSDFGFHNVIRRADGSFCFLDFEHAGWDDPAKLVADFVLQPESPLSAEQQKVFLMKLNFIAPFDADLERRLTSILPVQKVKWTGIILNVFERPDLPGDSRLSRLAKARHYWRSV